MKQITMLFITLIAALALACSNSAQTKPDGAQAPAAEAAQTAPTAPQPAPEPAAGSQNAGGPAPSAAPQTATAEGMNPPHGQPNHRCDIPVGAPLNSPPGKPPAQPTMVQQGAPVQPGPVQAAPVQTAPGMNPPHGQPNHRCDIPVGAPLDSPPGKKPAPAPNRP